MLKTLYKKLFSKKEVIELPKVKTVNISSKYLKNKLPDISEFNFKARRLKLGFTLRDMQEISSLGRVTVNRIENLKHVGDYRTVMKLHNFYLEEESKIK